MRSKHVYLFIFLIIVGFNGYGQSDPTDCGSFIPICSNGSLNENSNGGGINDFAFPGNNPGCLTAGEHQSVWLYVQIESGSTLEFDIVPSGGASQDYDFAVYGPSVDCTSLGNPIRCSYAAPRAPYGTHTGLNSSESDLSESAGGNGYVRYIDVSPGDAFYVLIDNWSDNNTGFQLNWTGQSNLDCSITANCPNIDLGADTVICDGGTLDLGGNTGPNDTYLWNTGETSSTITVADSGLYWLAATRDTCTVYDSIYVGLRTSPTVTLGSDTLLCSGETITLDATHPSATSYLWQDGSIQPQFTASLPGTYTVEVFNDVCSGTDQVVVNYDNLPQPDLGPDTTLCDGLGFLLNASDGIATNYLWQDGSTGSSFNAMSSGTYWVMSSNTACVAWDSVDIDFGNTPQLDLGPDLTKCEGTTVRLDATSTHATAYLWQDSSINSLLLVDSSGTYSVIASNAECSATDNIMVTFLPYPQIELGNDTVVCSGDDMTLDAYSAVATDYLWQDGSTAQDYLVTGPGNYMVTVTNDFCAVTDSIEVAFNSAPEFTLGPDTLLCHETDYPLLIGTKDDYVFTWQDNSSDTLFIVEEEGLYYVTVENQCGSVSDSIYVRYGSCNCNFYLPKGITPNGDRLNDGLMPQIDCDSLQSYQIEIFDRWGASMFQTTSLSSPWPTDGHGLDYPMEAYVWIIEYSWTWRGKLLSRKESGSFVIIR